MAEKQLLRDQSIEPSNEVIALALGAANYAYIKFVAGLKDLDIEVNWRYYTDGMAWLGKGLHKWTGPRGGQKEVTAFWLSIWDNPDQTGGFFKVTFYIPEKSRMDALFLPLDDEIKRMIEDAKQMGKLKFFPIIFDVYSDKLVNAIYMLADFRKKLK